MYIQLDKLEEAGGGGLCRNSQYHASPLSRVTFVCTVLYIHYIELTMIYYLFIYFWGGKREKEKQKVPFALLLPPPHPYPPNNTRQRELEFRRGFCDKKIKIKIKIAKFREKKKDSYGLML